MNVPILLRQVVIVSAASAILPVIYLLGWAIPISQFENWPSWLIYFWPMELMLLPFGGTANPLGFPFLVVSILSLIFNATIWCLVLIPAWRAVRRLLSRE